MTTEDILKLVSCYRDAAVKSILDVGKEAMSINEVAWVIMEAPEVGGWMICLTFFVDGRECQSTLMVHKSDLPNTTVKERADFMKSRLQEFIVDELSKEMRKDLFSRMSLDIFKVIE